MKSGRIELPQDWMERREKKGLSLLQIATATKIDMRYLEAIERGAFHQLPGSMYTESYIRQYARAVGDDEGALLGYYRSVFAPQEAPPAALPRPARWSDRLRDFVRATLGLTPDAPVRASKRREA